MNTNKTTALVTLFASTNGDDSEATFVNIKKNDDGDFVVDSYSSYADREVLAAFEMPFTVAVDQQETVSKLIVELSDSNIFKLLKKVAQKIEDIQDETDADCAGNLKGGEILDKNVASVCFECAVAAFSEENDF